MREVTNGRWRRDRPKEKGGEKEGRKKEKEDLRKKINEFCE